MNIFLNLSTCKGRDIKKKHMKLLSNIICTKNLNFLHYIVDALFQHILPLQRWHLYGSFEKLYVNQTYRVFFTLNFKNFKKKFTKNLPFTLPNFIKAL